MQKAAVLFKHMDGPTWISEQTRIEEALLLQEEIVGEWERLVPRINKLSVREGFCSVCGGSTFVTKPTDTNIIVCSFCA